MVCRNTSWKNQTSVLQWLDKLSLKLVAIDVKTSDAVPTADYINIQVDAAVNIKVGDEPQKLQKASQNFLNRDSEYIAKVAREVLEGNMREIVGKMRLEEMVSDRQKFAELVKENAEPDLAAMGLDIISFNVQNFVDSNQVIENLGIDNIVKIKKSAAIARANSEKEIKIAQARANKEANDERVLAETEIAKKNNDLAIKSAELKKESDIKKAEADAAYKIQEEQQRKELEITSANANIARQEREVELRAREVEVTEKSLEAEVKKKAEAERYAKQQQAEVIVAGHNEDQKQNICIGRQNNQNFVSIPFCRFLDILRYTAAKAGIPVVLREESYTSRASLLDLDAIPAYKKGDTTNHTFSGKRVHRGIYITDKGLFINADINGAGNILRKEYPSAFDGQELSYLYETTNVVSYTDIYAGATSLCKKKYNQKKHTPGMGSRANHQYRKERRHRYRSLWGKSRAA